MKFSLHKYTCNGLMKDTLVLFVLPLAYAKKKIRISPLVSKVELSNLDRGTKIQDL